MALVDINNLFGASDDESESSVGEDGNIQMSSIEDQNENASSSTSEYSDQYSDVDLSYLSVDTIPANYLTPNEAYKPSWIRNLSLHHNEIAELPSSISVFNQLVALDISNNRLLEFPSAITSLTQLKVLVAKNNQLDTLCFPKNFGALAKLEILNLSGNQIDEFPLAITELLYLKALYLGSNRLKALPCKIGDMLTLEVLYVGGNQLRDVPATIGKLKNLLSFVLCDNRLETIPSTVANLQRLENLSLHNNQLRTLPTGIVHLRNLQQLSLRSNPLVVRFVKDMTFDPPCLKELAGRAVKLNKFIYNPTVVPSSVVEYLDSAHHCVNPKCKGVYFDSRIEHVKFVDFCGKFRIPLLQYLCSPKCSSNTPAYAYTDTSSDNDESDLDEDTVPSSKLKKVLLG